MKKTPLEQILETKKRVRREDLTGLQVYRMITVYLEGQLKNCDIDLARFKEGEDLYILAKKRREWTEQMLIWVEHNV